MGADARRPRRSAAGLGALRGQVLDARDDGHDPEPGPERPQREGPGPRRRRRAVRLLLLRPAAVDVRQGRAGPRPGAVRRGARAGQGRPRASRDDAELERRGVEAACAGTTRRRSARDARRPFPQDPRAQLRAAIEAVFRSWNGARAVAYREREHISHDLGTAVNVQAMVFGNRDDDSGTGVAFTRNAATGENVPYGDFLLNAQGEDVVAGVRITEPLSAVGDRFPELHAPAARPHARDGGALPRHARPGVHHRAGHAVDAPGPRRQAHRRRGAAHGGRHDDRPAHPTEPGRGRAAGHPRAPRAGPAPAPRRHRPAGAHHRAGRVAGRGGRRGRVQRRRRREPRRPAASR